MSRAKAELWRNRFAIMYALSSWSLLGYVFYYYRIGDDDSLQRKSNSPDTKQEVHHYKNWLGFHVIRTVDYKQGPERFPYLKASFNVTDDSDPEK